MLIKNRELSRKVDNRSHLVRQTWTFIQERLSCNYRPDYGTGETGVPPETVGRCPAF
ncbi:MAG: hypothetical protein ACTSRU_07455 [Candidatus Hodarchaeales archaeon]